MSVYPDSDHDLETGAERRRYFRLNKIMPARLEETPGSGEPGAEARTWRVRVIDISAGGFRASCTQSIKHSGRFRARITLGRNETVDLTCHVVWERKTSLGGSVELGCEFDDVPAEDWKKLVDFIVREQHQAAPNAPKENLA